MAESVNTGGTRKFVYDSSYNPKNTPEEDAAMDEAWAIARERKRRQRIWKIVGIGLIAILILGVVSWAVL